MQPYHRPHEQLRTEAPKQKEHSDKYVSAIVSGESDVDMSFRSPVLQKSADHFKVGIDELTVNLSKLSMLETSETDVLFRIIRKGFQNQDGTGLETHASMQMPNAAGGDAAYWRNAFSFRVDRVQHVVGD